MNECFDVVMRRSSSFASACALSTNCLEFHSSRRLGGEDIRECLVRWQGGGQESGNKLLEERGKSGGEREAGPRGGGEFGRSDGEWAEEGAEEDDAR